MVLAVAAVISAVVKLLRQPAIVGYIISGFVVGPALLNMIHAEEVFETFSELGIALLLFMIGLGLNVSVVRSMGKPSVVTFLFIAGGLGAIGYVASVLLGFSVNESLIIAVSLLLSSTIIIIKVLSDKKGQTRLYGQLAIGIVLVDDIVATLALVYVAAQASGSAMSDFVFLALKGVGLGAALTATGAFVMPRIAKFFAGSQELLFLFSLAWATGVASAFSWAGFSLEVGALFAGVALAHLPYAQEMTSRLKPVRDFFIILFFVSLGAHLGLDRVGPALVPALIISAIVMTIKPLVTLIGLGVLGYTKQTNFKTSVHLSQISEFSIILVVLAASTGLVGEHLVTVITLVALITIILSTYLMQYDEKLYRWLERPLSIFERAKTREEVQSISHYPLVLLGYSKGGSEFVRTFKQMKKDYVVIDFDPDIIDQLERRKINHIYGDVTDLDLLEEIGLKRAEIVVSTIDDKVTNRLLAQHISKHNKDTLFICHATSLDEAQRLYGLGASHVILPHQIGSERIGSFILRHGNDRKAFEKYRQEHLVTIGQMAAR